METIIGHAPSPGGDTPRKPELSGKGALLRVLVVDDFAAMRRAMRAILEELGIRDIDEADGALAALGKLTGGNFDLMLLDIGMPGVGGLEFLHTVRRNEALRALPVIVVTAEAHAEEVVAAARAGAADYIVKPFTAQVLGRKLARLFTLA